jgi:hypothetical protein
LVTVPALPETSPVIKELKILLPEKVLLFASRVLEAAVIVMFCEPSNAVPLMLRGVARVLAVPALPEILPVMVVEKVLVPEKVLLSAKRVEEAALAVVGQADLQSPPIQRVLKLARVEKSDVEVAEVVVERVMRSKMLAAVKVLTV